MHSEVLLFKRLFSPRPERMGCELPASMLVADYRGCGRNGLLRQSTNAHFCQYLTRRGIEPAGTDLYAGLAWVSGLSHPQHSPWAQGTAKRASLSDRVGITHQDSPIRMPRASSWPQFGGACQGAWLDTAGLSSDAA